MAKYSPHQQKMLRLAMHQSRGDTPRTRQALIEAGLVESSWNNLNYGDRDSQGVLQQRPSQGWGPPGNAKQDINQFLQRARLATKQGFKGTPGELAQHIQRSAFPGRYDQRAGEAASIIKLFGGGGQFSGRSRTEDGGGYATFSSPPAGNENGQRRRQIFNYALAANEAFINDREAPNLSAFLLPTEGAIAEAIPTLRKKVGSGRQVPLGAGGTPVKGAKAMIAIIKEAQRRGLHVGENPYTDKVDAEHTEGSHHYQTYKGTNVGKASDVSGNPAKMQAFFSWLYGNRGRLGVNDLFHDPAGFSLDRGKRWNKTIGGHGKHVHVSTF